MFSFQVRARFRPCGVAMFRCLFASVVACRGALLSRPAGVADLEAIAAGAVHAAGAFEDAAKALPSQQEAARFVDERSARELGDLQAELRAEQVVAMSAGGRCQGCARDYGTVCPVLWSPAASGVCSAPGSYDGPCRSFGHFQAMTAAEKAEFERRCVVCWPCAGGAGPPGDSHGPVGFLALSSSLPDASVHLRPAEESADSILASVRGVAQSSVSSHAAADEAYSEAKRRLLAAERRALGRIVARGLRPLLVGSSAASFAAASSSVAAPVANVRLVEASAAAVGTVAAAERALQDALVALERRQQADEDHYSALLSAVARGARDV